MTTLTAGAVPLRFRPVAPEPQPRDLTLFQMLTSGAAQNFLLAIPRDAYEVMYRRVRTLNFVYHGVSDPKGIQHVFLDNAANYRKPRIFDRIFRPAIGEGLFTADGDAWRAQRRLMAPAFLPSAVDAFAPLFAGAAAQAARRLPAAIDAGDGVVDMVEEATRTRLAVIDGALFSGETGMPFDETSALVRAFTGGSTELTLGLLFGVALLDLGRPRQRLARHARRVLVSKMSAFIHRRADEPEPTDDFVTRLYRAFLAEHPRDEAIQLTLDNALTFFVAGHETTANGLAWALYLLAGDPQAQAWARDEAQAAWAAAGDDPGKLAARLPYLKMVWEETLRLYPPVYRIDREALADDEVCGRPVKKGDQITVWPWIVHRHQALWRARAVQPGELRP